MKTITPSAIKKAIIEEAIKIKRKKELYENVCTINNELRQLNEVNWVGTFGFKATGDNHYKTKTGFANEFQNISHIAQLEKEMKSEESLSPIKEDVLDEVNRLKEEVAALKKENEDLKTKK